MRPGREARCWWQSIPLSSSRLPSSGREHGVGLLKEHGRGLARMRVRAPLVEAKAGERSDDCLREHEVSHYCNEEAVSRASTKLDWCLSRIINRCRSVGNDQLLVAVRVHE